MSIVICTVALALQIVQLYRFPLVASPSTINLGTVSQGEKRTVYVTIRNTGGRNLTVAHIVTTCGCTTTSNLHVIHRWSAESLGITFDSNGKYGPINKGVMLRVSEFPQHPLFILITGRVIDGLVSNPSTVSFGKISLTSRMRFRFVISRLDGVQLGSLMLRNSNVHDVSYRRLSSDRTEVTGFITVDDDLAGYHKGKIEVNAPSLPALSLPVTYTVRSPYRSSTATVNFGVVRSAPENAVVNIYGPPSNLRIEHCPSSITAKLIPRGVNESQLILECNVRRNQIVADDLLLKSRKPSDPKLAIRVYAAGL
jgi:hypothetical protein